MSSTLDFYWAVVLTTDGEATVLGGSLQNPQKSVTITDGSRVQQITLTLAASDTNKVAWEWADTSGFEIAIFWCLDSGYLNAAMQVDTPTSEANQTPAGTTPVWYHRNLSCIAPMVIDTDRAYTHATEATAAGDSAGAPTLWADGSKVSGVVSKIDVRNPSSTDAVTLKGIIIQ